MDEEPREPRLKSLGRTPSPYPLEELLEATAGVPAGLKTGFPSLDRIVAIPQAAITVVAGRPAHGKTAFLLNLLVNMTQFYPDRTFAFFSYEESRRQVGLRLLNILAGTVITPEYSYNNMREIEDYVRAGRTDFQGIELGKERYAELLGSGRILLEDEPYTVEDWAGVLDALAGQHPIGAVFVDSIQRVKIEGECVTRRLELRRVSERMLEAAKRVQVPVIVAAQMERDPAHPEIVRLHDLGEAWDVEQDASLVLGLFNDAIEKAQEKAERPRGPDVDLQVTVLKNRNGALNQYVFLTFKRPILTLADAKDSSPW